MDIKFPNVMNSLQAPRKERKERADKKNSIAVSTTLSHADGEDWKILCQLAGKSSYQLLRDLIDYNVKENKAMIDSKKSSKTTGEMV